MAAAAAEKCSVRVCAFGDSLTRGYWKWGAKYTPYAPIVEEKMRAAGYSCMVEEYGQNGERVEAMVERLKELLDMCGDDYYTHVVILGGTNNIGTDNSGFIGGKLVELHKLAHSRGLRTVTVTTPQAMTDGGPRELIRVEAMDMLLEYANSSDKTVVVDLATAIPNNEEHYEYWDDSIHFSDKGYKRLAELVFEALAADVGEPGGSRETAAAL